MKQYRRLYSPGARYFFTVVTELRKPLLIENIDRLREAFRMCRERHPFKIEAIVILPDHIHTVWQLPEGDEDFSKRWMVIKRYFSSAFPQAKVSRSKIKKREKGIWQRRFWEHQIRDENDWRQHVDYIHFNPVKHGFVNHPQDWQYSSYQRAVEKGWYQTSTILTDDFENIGHE